MAQLEELSRRERSCFFHTSTVNCVPCQAVFSHGPRGRVTVRLTCVPESPLPASSLNPKQLQARGSGLEKATPPHDPSQVIFGEMSFERNSSKKDPVVSGARLWSLATSLGVVRRRGRCELRVARGIWAGGSGDRSAHGAPRRGRGRAAWGHRARADRAGRIAPKPGAQRGGGSGPRPAGTGGLGARVSGRVRSARAGGRRLCGSNRSPPGFDPLSSL